MKLTLKILLIAALSVIGLSSANAAWIRNSDGYYSSNICRYGEYWQVVPWFYVGTECYMPGWGIWGVRVAE